MLRPKLCPSHSVPERAQNGTQPDLLISSEEANAILYYLEKWPTRSVDWGHDVFQCLSKKDHGGIPFDRKGTKESAQLVHTFQQKARRYKRSEDGRLMREGKLVLIEEDFDKVMDLLHDQASHPGTGTLKQKDPLAPGEKCGVIYKIKCEECGDVYVGETERSLGERTSEHQKSLHQKDCKSALSQHQLQAGHNITTRPISDIIEIIDQESRNPHRKIKEAVHIQLEGAKLNRTEGRRRGVGPDRPMQVSGLVSRSREIRSLREQDGLIAIENLEPQNVPTAHSTPISVNRLFQRLGIDFSTVDFHDGSPKRRVLYAIDYFSRFAWGWVMPSDSGEEVSNTVAKLLLNHCMTLGLVWEELQSDNGSEFVSHVVRELMKALGVKIVLASPRCPTTGGRFERGIQTAKRKLSATIAQDRLQNKSNMMSPQEVLQKALYHYNNSCHQSLSFRGKNLCPVDVWYPLYRQRRHQVERVDLDSAADLVTIYTNPPTFNSDDMEEALSEVSTLIEDATVASLVAEGKVAANNSERVTHEVKAGDLGYIKLDIKERRSASGTDRRQVEVKVIQNEHNMLSLEVVNDKGETTGLVLRKKYHISQFIPNRQTQEHQERTESGTAVWNHLYKSQREMTGRVLTACHRNKALLFYATDMDGGALTVFSRRGDLRLIEWYQAMQRYMWAYVPHHLQKAFLLGVVLMLIHAGQQHSLTLKVPEDCPLDLQPHLKEITTFQLPSLSSDSCGDLSGHIVPVALTGFIWCEIKDSRLQELSIYLRVPASHKCDICAAQRPMWQYWRCTSCDAVCCMECSHQLNTGFVSHDHAPTLQEGIADTRGPNVERQSSQEAVSVGDTGESEKDPVLREKWAKQVNRTRVNWSPSERSVLCSAHFEAHHFDARPALKEKLGFAVRCKRVLLQTAIPTIFPRGEPAATPPEKPRTSRAVEKRRNAETIKECMASYEKGQKELRLDIDVNPPVKSCGVQAYLKPKSRDVAVQHRARARGRTKGVQVNMTPVTVKMVTVATQTKESSFKKKTLDRPLDEEPMSMSDEDEQSDSGSEYVPSDEEMEEDQDHSEQEPCNTPPKHGVFLVFWACLADLITTWFSCPECTCRKLSYECREVGTLLKVALTCSNCKYRGKWKSQPFYGRTAAGNILLSAAILFSGASVTKVLWVLSHMGVAVICARSFFRHQEKILFTAVERIWREMQVGMLYVLQSESPIVCGGDGRADSPGHCAKYGSYTLMELNQRKVIDVQLVQSNEVGGSYHMEQKGLEKSLAWMESVDVEVGTLVTDRHVGINKMIREDHPTIKHLFDIWHVAKSVKKKLQHLSQRKGCQVLKPWVGSIINHLYWAVVSSPDDNRRLAVDKWKSVVSHICNKHEGFQGQFPRCEHGPLEGREQEKAWLTASTQLSTDVEKIVYNDKLLKDIGRLSPVFQTWSLEAFHSLILHFAPKMFAFCNKGMESRVKLAALHFNENADRAHRQTGDGDLMYSVHYPKHKQGGYIVRKVLEQPSFGYVKILMESVKEICRGQEYNGDMLEGLEFPEPGPVPQPLTAQFEKPAKADAVNSHVTRFRL
ncbi:hypothetical protein Bbelb_115820 [Branchiostoma belcheri]|nr:hypothetical protein Bbelb_115820 [Branchiostoma belcheri]